MTKSPRYNHITDNFCDAVTSEGSACTLERNDTHTKKKEKKETIILLEFVDSTKDIIDYILIS